MVGRHSALRVLGPLISLTLFSIAAWFLHRELAGVDWHLVAEDIQGHSWRHLLLAVLCTVAGYATLTAYDPLALRYLGRSLPYRQVATTAFVTYAVGYNVGLAALSGGSVRYRMYSALGLSASEIGLVILFSALTFALGAAALGGTALLAAPAAEIEALGLPRYAAGPLGLVLLLVVACYVMAPLIVRGPLSLSGWRIAVPPISITATQVLVAIADLCLACATLYVLLPTDTPIGFLAFTCLYLTALGAGVLSSLPGGIGVFEAAILLGLPDLDRHTLLGTIIVYRLIYYVAPLAVAMTLFAAHEIRGRRQNLIRAGTAAIDWLSAVSPQLFAILVFFAGLVLLVSGATPAVASRLALLAALVPHAVLEASHVASSVLGLCLLVIARGLSHQLHSAYRLTLTLLLAGAAASILKGLDYEEATVLCGCATLLWVAREEFYRRGALGAQQYTAGWIVAILIALGGALWVTLVSFGDVPYSHGLWLRFSPHAEAPRALRALGATFAAAIAFSVWRLLRPAPPAEEVMSSNVMGDVLRVTASALESSANAALIGDKRFLFNSDHSAFVMYQLNGRSWIALGDPVGPRSAQAELAWRFREECDRHDGRPVFYEIAPDNLPLYIDMGLTLAKVGEEARIPLAEFSLEGSARADLRQARNRTLRAGGEFSVVPKSEIAPLISTLERISDDWLRRKAAAEKGFSLGRFSETYIRQFDCAIVCLAGSPVAFANLWPAPAGGELSVDLVRYDERAPNGTMDFLLTELILWARARGYGWFSLGMAPLSGLNHHDLAPIWHKIGNAVYRHGEEFYNFEGLRNYKQKFRPTWRPRYIACQSPFALPQALLAAATLVSGSLPRLGRK